MRMTLHDLPPHHVYRIEVQATRWRWSTHTSSASCHSLRQAAYQLHAAGQTWRIVSNRRDSIVTCDPGKSSWREAWTRAYRTATGLANAWSPRGGQRAASRWSDRELAAIADAQHSGIGDAELCAMLPGRSLIAVTRQRQKLDKST